MLTALFTGGGAALVTLFELQRKGDQDALLAIERNMRVAWRLIHHLGNQFSQKNGQLFVDQTPLNDHNEIVDAVSQLVGGTATIFMGDTRIATSVLKADGHRAIGTQLARNAAYEAIFHQKKPFRGVVDILGIPYITGYDPIFNADREVIGIVYVGIKTEEFYAGINRLEGIIVSLTTLTGLLGVGLAMFYVRRRIGKPIMTMLHAFDQVASGDLLSHIPVGSEQDEIGRAMRALRTMVESLHQMVAEIRYNILTLTEASQQMEQVSDELQQGAVTLKTQAQTVSQSASHLKNNMSEIAQAALKSDSNMATISAAAEQASVNMTTISAASEEAATTLTNVAKSAGQASGSQEAVRQAVERSAGNVRQVAQSVMEVNHSLLDVRRQCEAASDGSREANAAALANQDVMKKLTGSANEIGKVVVVIKSIAEQTNMLALNASIEATRAGEAGKGFAVVAQEVKQLARQTSDATGHISKQVEEIQGNVEDVTTRVQMVTERIAAISEANRLILQSVGVQSQTMVEIAQAMDQVAMENQEATQRVSRSTEGIADVTRNVSEISAGISEVTRNVSEATMGIEDMARSVTDATRGNREITANVTHASAISAEVAESVAEVSQLVKEIGRCSAIVDQRAVDIKKMAGQLDQMLNQFKV
ncbi:MAG: cache domain-containing protein [Magnetococcales bacterium]|nr:cache domain-containing protein [Magnetococcales bacterium]MBF0114478.1 cache domain-containing protein [Magnetococcales bacterium]